MNHVMPYHNIKNIKKQFDHIKVKDKAPFIRFTRLVFEYHYLKLYMY